MLVELLRIAALAVGHAYLTAVLINVVHGCGIRGRLPNTLTYLLLPLSGGLGLFLLISAALGGWESWPLPLRVYAWGCVGAALAVLPAVTAVRLLRRVPEGITGSTAEIDLRAEHGADALIGDHWRGGMMRWPINDSLRLVSQEWRVELPGLPRALDGLSIVHLTDLHMSRCYRPAFFEAVLHEAARWRADLVVYTGDLIEDDAALAWVKPLLTTVRGRLGTFAVLGNHDFLFDADGLRRELDRADIAVLDGRWAELAVDSQRLALGGTSAPWGPDLDLDARPEADLHLVLSHTPDRFPILSRAGIDLVLSGHNHGGQIRLPVVGPLLMPSVYSRRYDQGFFTSGRSLMYVSRGIGGEKPLRVNCPIEITRLVLRSPKRQDAATPNRQRRAQPENV